MELDLTFKFQYKEGVIMQGKVAIITGGVRGIGQAIAQGFAEAGASVYATSREADQPTSGLIAKPGEIVEIQLDVTDEESVLRFFHHLDETHGCIDVLVNNAGIGLFKSVEDTTFLEFEQVFKTNVTGMFLCAKEAFKRMKVRGGGRIINLSSVAGYIPLVDNGAYGASKYAVRGFSHILNEEGKPHNIRVSVVSPGAVYSEIWEGREGFAKEDMLLPEDVAATVLDIAHRPLHVRIDEVKIMPSKGVL